MKRFQILIPVLLLGLAFVLEPIQAAEGDANGGAAGAGNGNGGNNGGRRRGQGGGQAGQGGNNGGQGGQGQGGRGGPGGFGGGGFPGNLFGGGGGGPGGITGMLNNALGIETPLKLNQLNYGTARNFVLRVPVGGIDNLQDRPDGWKAETVFTLTEEKQKSLDTLREDYKKELEKLQKEFDTQNAAIVDKVKALRLQYEGKANELLPAEAKTQKEKLDALAKEHSEKLAKTNEEQKVKVDEGMAEFDKALVEARKNGDFEGLRELGRKNFEVLGKIREGASAVAKETSVAMQAALTEEPKTKLTDLFTKLEAQRNEQRNQWGGGRQGGQGGPGGPGGGRGNAPAGDGKPEKPAPPPDNF